MRIAISTQTFNRVMGGGGVFAVQLAGGLAEAGHEVMVMTPRGSAGRVEKNLDGRIRLAEVRSVSLEPFYRGIYIPVSPTKEVERLLDAFQPDVVHLMDHYPLSHSAAALARKRGLPLMATNNFLPDNIILNFKPFMLFHPQVKSLLWKMALDVFNQASLVATPSEEGVAILRAQGLKTPATAISSGYDPARFHLDPTIEVERYRQGFRIDTVKPVFLYVGRLENEKHVDCLIRALAQIERKDVQLAIGGKGPLEGRLRQLVKELGLEERVIFTGFIPGPDLPCLLNSVDFFAMAGDTELQSIATLEAMACGRPVLAAQARALPELVKHQVNGYLFESNNPADAAEGMRWLIDHLEDWPKMSAASLEITKGHEMRNTVARYEACYREVIGRVLAPRV